MLPQQELETQSSNMDGDVNLVDEEMEEKCTSMSPGESHALFMKTFAWILKDQGLWSPQYYEDKSQCVSFADIRPAEKGIIKAHRLKAGFIEPADLIKRLQQLKPSENFELREYKHPGISWVKPPLYHEDKYPPDITEESPLWVFEMYCRLFHLLGNRRCKPFFAWLDEHWKKIELSLNRTPLPDLRLLKNHGSSPNGTIYPRYLIQGLHSLRESVEDKVKCIYEKKVTKAAEKRKATVLDWEERHPDIKLNHDLTCMYRTWPSNLMDKLDEIDRQTAWSQRRIHIDRLVKAEKQMQELVNFWKDCKLINGQRTPLSPPIQWPDSIPIRHKSAANPEKTNHQAASWARHKHRPKARSSKSRPQAQFLIHRGRKSSFPNLETSGMDDSDPAQKTTRQVTAREAGLIDISLFKSSAQRSTRQKLEISGMDAFVPARENS